MANTSVCAGIIETRVEVKRICRHLFAFQYGYLWTYDFVAYTMFGFQPQSTKLTMTNRKSALLMPVLVMNTIIILLIKNQW
jgi:hypothetical protein